MGITMADDLVSKVQSMQNLRADFGEKWYAQGLARLREQFGAEQVDALLAVPPTPPRSDGIAITISTEQGTIKDAPVNVVGHAAQVTFAPPADPAVARGEAALDAYLRRTLAECNALPLGQIDRTDADHVRPLQLAQLYIRLHTTRRVPLSDAELAALSAEDRERMRVTDRGGDERPTRPLAAVEALGRSAAALDGAAPMRLMLLGAPGSGKSTLVSHLALCLAGAVLAERRVVTPAPQGGWLACLPGWPYGCLIPVRMTLRDLAAFAPLASAPRGTLRLFEQFLAAVLEDASCAAACEPLMLALREGRALLLLDGLDEVVGQTVLPRVVETIMDAAKTFPGPILVTCRLLDYQEERLRQVSGFPSETLAELNQEQIQQFIEDWYAELAASGRRPAAQAAADSKALRAAVASRSELRALAGTPLLLTVMALVHAFRGSLPDARALLYAECVDLLLLRWRQPRGESDLIERLGLPQFRNSDLLALMARLGYAAHERAARDATQTGPADLDEATVMALLAESFAPYDDPRRYQLAELVLGALTRGNGLLLKRGPQVYTFAHRTFQEFLAGYHLKGQRDFRKLCLERAVQPHWHEVLTLMVGYLVLQDRDLDKPLSLVEKLISGSPLEQTLAGELLVLIGRERADAYDATLLQLPDGLWPRTRSMLLRLLSQGQPPAAPAPLRHRAGLALGLLCYGPLASLDRPALQIPMPDPRLPFAVLGLKAQHAHGWRQALAHYWCPIEAGPFWSGDERPPQRDTRNPLAKATDMVRRTLGGQARDEHREPLRRVTLRHHYKIARYPVTNAEFARFVAAGGYQQQQWWTEHGWAWLQSEQQGKNPALGNEYRPRVWDELRWNNPIQPVVGVNWYEASAYCRWLSAQGHSQGWLPDEQIIRLPTWLEWERAARHTDQRPHPWGDAPPDAERANYAASELGLSAPTGCFPRGVAPCGAHDLLGNVMEWTATAAEHPRAVEPEADFERASGVIASYTGFNDEEAHMCCGARGGINPSGRGSDGGFRVVQSIALIE
ncbi:MAG: hypothetical protein EI684_04410 [Candidatus Viridilinea halotolerans]|uniref:Sulfatase-modifying factor enzyme-like domain-containing protein n=1 Tax=Candidatus Viridilinea halotolerans TaxID=2491704 RepID=A0A426U695_9CHLR|nr:MAG: hypothetical protein EI684_04410 [Candidatus Viridilinea halotolerans]